MNGVSAVLLFSDTDQVLLKSGMMFSTRVARAGDLEVLDRLYTQNMKGHVERLATWAPNMFRENFEPRAIELIEVAGNTAGFIRIVQKPDSIYLAELQIGRPYQGYGIGGAVLRKLIDYASTKKMLITLKVIRGNPAEFFYRRHGFRTFKESALHLHLSLYPRGMA